MSKIPKFLADFMAEEKKAVLLENLGEGAVGKVYPGDPGLAFSLGGGFAGGKLNVLAGESGTGKSTLAQKLSASLQAADEDAFVFIFDTEYALDDEDKKARLQRLGLGKNTFVLSSNDPNKIFKMLSAIDTNLKAGKIKIAAIVYDSLGSLQDSTANAKMEKGDVEGAAQSFGGQAKLLGTILKRLISVASENGVTVFLVQHAMVNMDIMTSQSRPWIITGGQKLRYLAATMMLMTNIQRKDAGIVGEGDSVDKSDKDTVLSGKMIRYTCVKSRYCVEGRKVDAALNFENGEFVQTHASLARVAKLTKVAYPPAGKGTGWLAVRVGSQERQFYGEPKFIAALQEDASLSKNVLEQVLQREASSMGTEATDTPFDLRDAGLDLEA